MTNILFPKTLSWYFFRLYVFYFFVVLAGLLSIVYLFDVIELARRASSMQVSMPTLIIMGLFKLPEAGQIILPFVILFSAMMTFWHLTKHQELVIIRAAGLSIWQFILPMILTASIIGLMQTVIINPVGTIFLSKYKSLESTYLDKKSSQVLLSEQGLWLRQPTDNGKAIMHAEKVKMPEWTLTNVTVLFFDESYNFLQRLDSAYSYLKDGQWHFRYAVVNRPDDMPRQVDNMAIDTDLSIRDLEGSFADPETVSFWKIKNHIKVLEETGFNPIRLKIHMHSLLAQPLMFMALVLLAAAVSMRSHRFRGTGMLILSGIGIGFVIFFATNFMVALGISGQVPVFVAAWFPPTISFLLGLGVMMVLEDG